jgi:hypothetical protein
MEEEEFLARVGPSFIEVDGECDVDDVAEELPVWRADILRAGSAAVSPPGFLLDVVCSSIT